MKKILLPLLLLLAFTCPSFAQEEQAADAAMPINLRATPEFQAVQNQVMTSPDIMSDIQKLLSDPEVMSIISDPEFIAAIQSGNMEALSTSPRLQRLTENANIKALIEKIKSQQ